MSVQVTPLFREKHAALKISRKKAFAHIESQHIVPVVLHEFVRVAAELPIVFIKNNETGNFEAVTMLSLTPGENLMVQEGEWQGGYVPRVLRNYPLALMEDGKNPEQLLVALIESSPMVNTEEGFALFNEDGTESDFLKARTSSLGETIQYAQMTKAFNKILADLELLVPQSLTMALEGKPREINGIYIVDEKKLQELSDEQFLDLRKKGLLPAIYAHLMSLQQVQRLGERETRKATAA
ncbi:MAG: SapC family protein [Gammaproteobacteria bacterium]|nr:SapC family protein [Gammaproteobacteria bacterium]MBU2056122.1 SapC family protein [Gammaproteobacteria bacterium]MBU2175692.1 SapC family protein [Gammaproteobacteria bacterium]MBU2245399.1 SapC family protein [Gammaproteobacteria bacterium]MBU2344684.1 SapC family protein [Gammaproteobacteria bacterium]